MKAEFLASLKILEFLAIVGQLPFLDEAWWPPHLGPSLPCSADNVTCLAPVGIFNHSRDCTCSYCVYNIDSLVHSVYSICLLNEGLNEYINPLLKRNMQRRTEVPFLQGPH